MGLPLFAITLLYCFHNWTYIQNALCYHFAVTDNFVLEYSYFYNYHILCINVIVFKLYVFLFYLGRILVLSFCSRPSTFINIK